jgi:hypothetical protein
MSDSLTAMSGAGPATSVDVDRLSLHAGAMSETDGRRLAELVGLALGRLPVLPHPVDTAKVAIDVAPGSTVEQLAEAVAAAIEAALRAEAVS